MTEFEKALTKAKKFVSQITREIHLIQSFLDHGQIPAAYGAALSLEQYSERLTFLSVSTINTVIYRDADSLYKYGSLLHGPC